MLKLVKGYHKRTGLTETVLVISISVCTNSTVSIRNSAGTSIKGLVYPEFLVTVFVLGGLHYIDKPQPNHILM